MSIQIDHEDKMVAHLEVDPMKMREVTLRPRLLRIERGGH